MPDNPFDGDGVLSPTSGLATSGGSATITQPQRAPQITRNASGKVNMYRLGERVILYCKDLDIINVTITNLGAAVYPTVTFENQVSTDGFNFQKLTGSTDLTGPNGTSNFIVSPANVTVQGWTWFALSVSVPATPSTTYHFARVDIQGKSNT